MITEFVSSLNKALCDLWFRSTLVQFSFLPHWPPQSCPVTSPAIKTCILFS